MDCILPQIDRLNADEMFFAYGKAIDDRDGDDDYEGRATLPGSPYGLTFFHGLRLEPNSVPKLRSGTRLSGSAFNFFFDTEFEDIREGFFRSGQTVRSGLRSRNKVQRTRRYVDQPGSGSRSLFHLRVRGVALRAPDRDPESDQDMEREEGEEEEGEDTDETDVDKQLTKLWRQFIVDVTEKVPNRKRADEDGYCCLSPSERQAATDGYYQNLQLSDFFNDCQWRIGGDAEWDAVFNHLFPLEEKRGKVQNYGSTRYYSLWQRIKDCAESRETAVTIQRALKSKFNTLLWFPAAQADRIWPTAPSPSRFKKFVEPRKAAPWVICRRRPSWRSAD
jgi:hypothetical protein